MWNKSWDVNVTSTHLLTYALAPLLIASSSSPRLIFLTSGTSTLGGSSDMSLVVNHPPAAGWPKPPPFFTGLVAYRSVKTGLNMLMTQWHRILLNDGVKVFAVSPGLLATGLGGRPELLKNFGAKDPAEGAAVVRDVVEGKRDDDVGQVIWTEGRVQPW